jgi:hypothetical protein
MNIKLTIQLDEDERSIICGECEEEVRIDPQAIYVVLGRCELCDCNIGIQIGNVEVVNEKDRQ